MPYRFFLEDRNLSPKGTGRRSPNAHDVDVQLVTMTGQPSSWLTVARTGTGFQNGMRGGTTGPPFAEAPGKAHRRPERREAVRTPPRREAGPASATTRTGRAGRNKQVSRP